MSFSLSDPDQHLGLDIESLGFHKNQAGLFEEIVRLDYNGLNFVNGASWPAMDLYIWGNGGQLDLHNGNSNRIVWLGSTAQNSSEGNLRLYGPNGSFRQYHAISSDNYGYSYWYGQNATANIYLGRTFGYPNRVRIILFDDSEVQQAGIYVNDLGQGVVWGDIKSFSMQHHLKRIPKSGMPVSRGQRPAPTTGALQLCKMERSLYPTPSTS